MPLRQGIGTDTNIDSSCSPLSGTTARRGNLLEELSSQTYNLDVFATLSARNYSFSYSGREQPVKLATLANGSPPSHTLQSSDWQQGLTTSAESSSQTHSNEEMTQPPYRTNLSWTSSFQNQTNHVVRERRHFPTKHSKLRLLQIHANR